MTNAQDALQAAIESVGAVEVAPGHYAYKQNERWRILTDAEGPDVMMPTWWRPDAQRRCHACEAGSRISHAHGYVTADLATGEEVPC